MKYYLLTGFVFMVLSLVSAYRAKQSMWIAIHLWHCYPLKAHLRFFVRALMIIPAWPGFFIIYALEKRIKRK